MINGDMKVDKNVFTHVVSLGWFCSVARELEKAGLREFSMPFDWCLSPDWGG